ncbi:mechanosensitive ion channel family protein [Paraglaciecola hydrolytica]|uniref:Mechanosensitive ion channel protein n=1 Tax=Paraglaciecola hydrolytica TaxID=1799789 RepID=A0A136A3J8_9ALTE|nr:mechanosensitive ion channel domain-containing protein [Paraglaciecola hydrolytica]KXI29813.1 mechanosensitive ion channel protein [Paraglaciecola hydrolytica]
MTLNEIIALFGIPVFSVQDKVFTLGDILMLPAFLLVGYLLINWTIRLIVMRMRSKGVAPDVVHLVRRILFILAFLALFITTLDLINVPITAFAFLSGAVAIGFGFGAQNIINNFISGWILMWERPIRIGDFLEVDDVKGNVEAINTRSTRIRRTDGVHMMIPNSKLLENTVVNWTLMDNRSRTTISVGVAYGSPCRLVASLIEQAVAEQQDVLKEPAPTVIFDDFGDNALMFVTYFWMNASVEGHLRMIRSNIRFRIDELFAENDICIAFPQRDIHIDGNLTVRKAEIE